MRRGIRARIALAGALLIWVAGFFTVGYFRGTYAWPAGMEGGLKSAAFGITVLAIAATFLWCIAEIIEWIMRGSDEEPTK